MQEQIIEYIKTHSMQIAWVSAVMIALVVYISPSYDAKTLEQKLKDEITILDAKRDENISNIESEINTLTQCKDGITKDKGTTEPIKECDSYINTNFVPQANAMVETNTWTATGAINPVPEQVKTLKDELLMERICAVAPNSPLCGKWELYFSLKKITEDRLPPKKYWRMWEILLGISYAESHLGQNYANDNVGGTCAGRNNFWGTKYQILDNNTRVHSRQLNGFNYWEKYHWRYTDQYGCNLFPFKSVKEYWITKVNWMRFGYPSCIINNTKPIACLSRTYLTGNKKKWITNVSSFLIDESIAIWQP